MECDSVTFGGNNSAKVVYIHEYGGEDVVRCAEPYQPTDIPNHVENNVIDSLVTITPARNVSIEPQSTTTAQVSVEDIFSNLAARSVNIFTGLLDRHSQEADFIRAQHLLHRKHRFALASVVCQMNVPSGGHVRVASVGVLYNWSIKPFRCFSITISRKITDASSIVFLKCTCNPTLTVSHENGRFACKHIDDLRKGKSLLHFVSSKLNNFTSEGNKYFGDDLSPSGRYKSVHLISTQPSANRLHSKQADIFLLYDVDQCCFVPLVKESDKPLHCQSCRGGNARRGSCIHEITCAREIVSTPGHMELDVLDGNAYVENEETAIDDEPNDSCSVN